MTDQTDIIARLKAGEISNELDVLIEVALFAPEAKANNAGTKVIYANEDGTFSTHWAPDHSLDPERTLVALAKRAAKETAA